MNIPIDTLFDDAATTHGKPVAALNHQDIVVALSGALATQRVALLHMLYPRTDARTHNSLDSLVDALHNHGLHEVARLISQEAHYLLFKEPGEAWKAFNQIRNHSLAIGVHLYYNGLVGEGAERALDAHAHGRA